VNNLPMTTQFLIYSSVDFPIIR